MSTSSSVSTPTFGELEAHRAELTAHCYRMLGSPFEAEDAVQDTLLRAWRSSDRFEGRSSVRSWLYRIATNVCLDMLNSRKRRARPMDLGPAMEPIEANLSERPNDEWLQPVPDTMVGLDGDPAELAVKREQIRLAFVAALQNLPPRQRAALILCEVLQWKAAEAAELLDMTVAGVNSALQRARATLASQDLAPGTTSATLEAADRDTLERYVAAFEHYDMDALAQVIHQDAIQSMPPFALWLRGRDDILSWFVGPGNGCRGSIVIPTTGANGLPAFGQYKPSPSGGHEPWALMVVRIEDGLVAELTFFLETETLFPLFGLPERPPEALQPL
jgi:RNA polymerase sigma-70 factor (ECF subfamily)